MGIFSNKTEALITKYEDSLSEHRTTIGYLSERIDELELQITEQGWIQYGHEELDFSKEGLDDIIRRSRLMALKNPLINRAVEVQMFYVWGQGFTFQAKDEKVQEILMDFWNNPYNQAELSSLQALEKKERKLVTEGNIFFVFFQSLAGDIVVRSIPFNQITDVVKDPEDSKVPLLYKREWTKRQLNSTTGEVEEAHQKRFYPHWKFGLDYLSGRVGDIPVEDGLVYHVAVGGLDEMTYGVPEVYSGLDWAIAYKNFLEDWATIVRAHRTFAWQIINQIPGGVEAAKTKMESTFGIGEDETNPAPGVGSYFLGTPGQKIEPVKTGGATVTAEDGRRLMLMAASALGFGENFFGDVKTGNLATAQTLDRPTELKITQRRKLWKTIFKDIFSHVIEAKVSVGELKENVDRHIDISFPDVLEHDIEATINSITRASTLDGKPIAGTVPPEIISTLLLTALGVDNVSEVVEQMDFSKLNDIEDSDDEETREKTEKTKEALKEIEEVYKKRLGISKNIF